MYNIECDVKMCECHERRLLSKYSHIRRSVIGHSALNRKIIAYTVGVTGSVLMCGAFHGMERVTAAVLYRFLDDLSAEYEQNSELKEAFKHTGCTIIPMVNPDGVEISANGEHTAKHLKKYIERCLANERIPHSRWQANARGVDINHNFDADFYTVKQNERDMGITSPRSTRYGGEYPESEKETRALCDFCRQQHFSLAVALHSQGREIYYDFGRNTPNESTDIANNMSALSGYTVSHPQGVAVGGGFKDWFIEHLCKPAFTLEIGKGKNPLPSGTVESEYPLVSKMLWYLVEYAIKNSDE